MMFSSNQVLEVSGSLNQKQVYNALEFAMKVSGDIDAFTRKDQPARCVFQITEDGKYCIGWALSFSDTNDAWDEYPFEFDLNTISQIIVKHLENQEVERDNWHGSYYKGFIMKAIPESISSEYEGIKNPFHGIVQFEPYTCFYSNRRKNNG